MQISIMQPYFFPYIGYFQLIANTDNFIIFDVVKYNKKSWMSRNRIIHPNFSNDFQYINAPIIKNSSSKLIKDTELDNNQNWQAKLIGQLTIYKKLNAPYYESTIALIKKILNQNHSNLLMLNTDILKTICDYLEIKFDYQFASNINFDRQFINEPGDWALAICNHLKANKYLNPPSGYKIFDENKYYKNNVELSFIKPDLKAYEQGLRKEFTPGLSIIDILMFNSKQQILRQINNNFRILNKKQLDREISYNLTS